MSTSTDPLDGSDLLTRGKAIIEECRRHGLSFSDLHACIAAGVTIAEFKALKSFAWQAPDPQGDT